MKNCLVAAALIIFLAASIATAQDELKKTHREMLVLLNDLVDGTLEVAQTSLTCKWEEGDKFSYLIEDKLSTTAGSGFLNESLKLDTNWHVNSVGPNGRAVIAVEIERVRFKADHKIFESSDWEQLSFDSKNPVEAQNKLDVSTFSALNSFVGSQMEITINEKREVTKFELSKPLAAHLEKDPMTLELAGFYGPTFTTNGMRRRITSWLIPSPSKPVSKGETWRREQSSRYEDFFVCVDTYTLEGPTRLDGHLQSILQLP